MKKRFISLFLSLVILLSALPTGALADRLVLNAETRTELQRYYDLYGKAALDVYAQETFRPIRSRFFAMDGTEKTTFRVAVEKIHPRDPDNWFQAFRSFLVDRGYSVTSGNYDYAATEAALYIEQMFNIASLEEMSIKQIVEDMDEYVKPADKEKRYFGLAMDFFLLGMDIDGLGIGKDDLVAKANKKFRKNYARETSAIREYHLLDKLKASWKAKDYIQLFADAAEGTMEAKKQGEPLYKQLIQDLEFQDTWNQIDYCIELCERFERSGVENRTLAAAIDTLQAAYPDFLKQYVEALAEHGDTLTDKQIAKILEWCIIENGRLAGSNIAGVALNLCLYWASKLPPLSLAAASYSAAYSFGNVMLGTTDSYRHFQAMYCFDRIYQELLEDIRWPEDGDSWMDYADYVSDVRILIRIAMMGESHLYTLTTLDAGLFQEVVSAKTLEQNHSWYKQRIAELEELDQLAADYLQSLKIRKKLTDVFVPIQYDSCSLDALPITICGEIIEDNWYAKVDDPERPDYDKPNPDAGEPVVDLPVYIMQGDTAIAKGYTDAKGRYRITVYYDTVAGHDLTVAVGDKTSSGEALSDDWPLRSKDYYVIREIPCVSDEQLTIRSSFTYNYDQDETVPEKMETQVTVRYADDYFLTAPDRYNHLLAQLSLGLAAASMADPAADGKWNKPGDVGRDANIREAWKTLGFRVVRSGGYDVPQGVADGHAGFTIAERTVKDEDARGQEPKTYRVVGVAIQGDSGTAGLANALQLFYSEKKGAAVADKISKVLSDYLTATDSNVPVCLWITGFGYGGDIASRVVQRLCRQGVSLADQWDKLFAYTFGASHLVQCPQIVGKVGVHHLAYDMDTIAMHQNTEGWRYYRKPASSPTAIAESLASASTEPLVPTSTDTPVRLFESESQPVSDGAGSNTNPVVDRDGFIGSDQSVTNDRENISYWTGRRDTTEQFFNWVASSIPERSWGSGMIMPPVPDENSLPGMPNDRTYDSLPNTDYLNNRVKWYFSDQYVDRLTFGLSNCDVATTDSTAVQTPLEAQVVATCNALTDFNASFDPAWMEGNTENLDALLTLIDDERSFSYEGDRKALTLACVQYAGLCGSDFNQITPEACHEAVLELVGAVPESLEKDIEALLQTAMSNLLPIQPMLSKMNLSILDLAPLPYYDVLLLTAWNLQNMTQLSLDSTVVKELGNILIGVTDEATLAVSATGLSFANHPEIYLAWLLSMAEKDIVTFPENAVMNFNTRVMPKQYNLCGYVRDEDTHKPLYGVLVTATDQAGKVYEIRTDAEGFWRFNVNVSDIDLTYTLHGYEDEEEHVKASAFANLPVEQLTYMKMDPTGPVYVLTESHYEKEAELHEIEVILPVVYIPEHPEAAEKINRKIREFDELFSRTGEEIETIRRGAERCSKSSDHIGSHDYYARLGGVELNGGLLSISLVRGNDHWCTVGHGWTERKTFTFDVRTGKQITSLRDLLNWENEDAEKQLIEAIDRKLQDYEQDSMSDTVASGRQVYNAINRGEYCTWTLSGGSIDMSFDRQNLGFEYPDFIYLWGLEGIIAEEYLQTASGLGGGTVELIHNGSEELAKKLDLTVMKNTPSGGLAVVVNGLVSEVEIPQRFYAYAVNDVMIMLPAEGSYNPHDELSINWRDSLGWHKMILVEKE